MTLSYRNLFGFEVPGHMGFRLVVKKKEKKKRNEGFQMQRN